MVHSHIVFTFMIEAVTMPSTYSPAVVALATGGGVMLGWLLRTFIYRSTSLLPAVRQRNSSVASDSTESDDDDSVRMLQP